MAKKEFWQPSSMMEINKVAWEYAIPGVRRKIWQANKDLTCVLLEADYGHEAKPIKHEQEKMVFVRGGACTYYVEDEVYEMDEMCLLAIPPKTENYYVAKPGTILDILELYSPANLELEESESLMFYMPPRPIVDKKIDPKTGAAFI